MYSRLLLILIIAICGLSVSAWAKSPPPGAGSGNLPANILLMLDTSGSMNNQIPSGDTRYPYDVAIDSSGNIYVAKYYDYVEKYDSNKNYVKKWGGYDYYSPSNGKFRRIYSIAVDSSGFVYVADRYRGRVQKFNSDGVYVSKINLSTSQIRGVEVDSSGNIYAVNGNGKVEKYNSSGVLQQTWTNTSARYISIDSSNDVYLSTWSNRKIEKYDSNGNLQLSFNTSFDNLGIEVDNSGNIYVSDYYNGKIHQYDSAGTHLQEWGSTGSSLGQFNLPRGIAKDTSGNMWVADRSNHRIQSPSGTLLLNNSSGTRLDSAKSVIKSIVSDSDLTSGANFGLMEWDTYANMTVNISSTGAANIFNTIDSVTAGGYTYLGNAMGVAQSYFTGSNSPITPGASACEKNLIIVISDGYWQDNPDPTAASLYANNGITTFVVGFQTTGNSNYVSLSQNGNTYPSSPLYASNEQNLLEVLTDYITQVITTQLTFSAPTIMPGVTTDDHILQSTFKYKADHQWKGYFYKYELNDDGSIGSQQWEAGSLLNQRTAASRQIWTVDAGLTTSLNNFTTSNVDELRPSLEENAGTTYTDDQLTDLIDFIRGVDSYDEFANDTDDEGTSLMAGERWKLADIYHSRAVVVGAPNAFTSDAAGTNTEAYYRYTNGYNTFKNSNNCGGGCSSRTEMIYVGGNGGMLHAFNSSTGAESWAFIPPSVLPNLKDTISLEANKSVSIYGVDGTPVVKDIYYGGSWRTVLMAGLRQGGKSYFALDVTDPANPTHLFTFSHNSYANQISYWDSAGTRTDYPTTTTVPSDYDFTKLGEAWSQPIITNIPISGTDTWVAVFGGGYNSGINPAYAAQLYVINLEDGGKIINNISISDTVSTNGIVNAVPPRVTALTGDSTSLFTANGALVYLSDLEGKLWKVNLSDQGTLYDTTKIFLAESTSTNGRFSFHETAAALTSSTNTLMHYYGTGNIQSLSQISSNLANRGFAIKDTDFPSFTSTTAFTSSSLANAASSCPTESQKGWYINLDSHEKITAKATVKNSTVIFSRYTPDTTALCSAGNAKISEHDPACGTLLAETALGLGVPTEAVVYKNKIYIGISTDQAAPNLPSGFTKQGNIIVGTPNNIVGGSVNIESWWED